MPAQRFLISRLALLVLLGTVRAGPFSPRSNVTLPAPRPPPQPGGRTVEPVGGSPSSRLYEHTVEGGEKQVVFTHRINLPPSASCGCPPGTEPPVPASEVQALKVRLEILEELVKGLKEQCAGGCCPAAAQAGTGQTDVRSLCSLHGVFDLSRCACSCEPGWGGPTCSDPTGAGVPPSTPPSVSGSCPDDCNDQGRCVRGRCVCFPGYSGPSCGWPSCPGDCNGRGRCVQGVCVCRAGFSGYDCSQRSCPRGCSQRGRCEDGRCVCDPGYTGEDCGKRSCPRGCSQRGRCENGRCVCDPGYTGDDCGVRSCPRGCSQRGRCEDGRCVCDPGYTGDDCGSRSCPWDCGEGGRCVDGRCVCWPGYAGEDCSTRTCPRDCRGRGRCEDGECICDSGYSGDDCGVRSCPGDCNQRGHCEDGRCVCWPGYTGPDCGSRACPRDCRGRGRCENGVCVCNAGYSGEDCGVRSCPGDCRGRGRCESGRCVCWPGYTGRDCGTRACPGDCRGRGRCVDGRCVCNPGFAGEDCGSRRCPGDCRGRGRCEDGVCVCNAGYEGEDCGVRSCPGGCHGRGQCHDGRCLCDDDYSGEDCSINRCPRDCSQHGVCQDGVCTCWEGYAGEDCGLRTCPSNCHQRGRCEDGRCVCNSGYTGPSCATRTCPADCRGRGRCVQGVCVCHVGYSGEDCGQEEPPASACPGGCGPRELCRAGQCVCVEGFRGPDCAIQTCPGDCRGRGDCREGSCVCQDGYAGEDCGEARVPSSASAYDQRGLAPGQEYQVTVRALRGTSWGPPASNTITTMIDGPQDLRVVAVTPTTLELSWLRPQAEVDQFVVSYVSAGNQRVRLEVPPEADGTVLTDLMPGVEYVVTVTAERGRAVSYPASVRANTEEGEEEPGPGPSLPQPPRRAWGNLTGELGRFRGTVQDLERHLRAHGYPLRANQTYASVARHIHEYLQRQVLGSSADGSLLVSLDGLRGHFERVVLRWWPQPPAEGPGGELTVPGTTRTVSLPDLRPGTTYHVEVHGVRAGQTSKSYAFITTTATDEPPPSGPSTTQGVQAPELQQRPQELGELRVLGRDKTGKLRVAWTAQPDTFAHFQLHLRVPEGPGVHEELLPGDVRQALVPSPPPGVSYELSLRGVPPEGEPSAPLIYQSIMDRDGAKPGKPLAQPRLGELMVTDPTSNSLLLHWTVPEGEFDSFVIQYKDRDGPQVVPVEGSQRSARITNLDIGRKYKFVLYGLLGKKRHGPLVAEAKILPQSDPSPATPPHLGKLWVTDPTPDSLRLSWTVPEGQFDSFVVQYRDRDGQPQVMPVEGPERSVIVSSLDPNHKYRFTLFGVANKKRHGPLTADGTTASEQRAESLHPESPAQPLLGELSVTQANPDSLRLAWTVPQGSFDSFVVQYKDAQGQPQVVPVRGDENEVTIPGLEPHRKYKMNLYGLHGRQRVGPVSVVATTAPQDLVEETPSPTEPSTEALEPPEEPLLGELTVTGSSPDSLSLSWTIPQGHFDSFTVQYKDGDGRPQVVRVRGDENEVIIGGLEPGRRYKVHLYGLHEGQRQGPPSTVSVSAPHPEETPATEPPLEPRLGELTVTDVTPNSVGLSWTVPEGQFDSFVVQYKDRDGQPQVVPVAADQHEVTILGLEPARKYRMNFYGLHDGQHMGPLSVVAVTAPATESPQEPQLGELTVLDMTPDSVTLSWTVPNGEFDSFMVQYKDRDGQPHVVPVAADQHEVTIPGLEPSRKYKFLVYGLQDGKRRSPVSVEAKTAAQGDASLKARPRLGELWVTDPTLHSLHLSWTVPEGHFDSFVVQFKDRDGPHMVPVEGHERSVTVTPLDPGRKYRFLLYGLLGKKRHGPLTAEGTTELRSGVDDARTKHPPKPRLGEELQVTSVTPDSVSLAWTVPEGHFDSFVVQYKDRDGQPQVVPVEGSLREVSVSGLDPARRYKLLLYGLYQGKRVGPISTIALTAPREDIEAEAPSPPGPEPRLGEVTVEEATPDTLHLSWTETEGDYDSFEVHYTDQDGQLQVVRIDGDRNDVILSGLESEHRYLVNLYGFRGQQRVGPAHIEALTAPREEEDEPSEPPTKPRLGELAVTDATSDSLHLSWTVLKGQFDHFLVQYKNGDGQPKAVRVPGYEEGVTVSGLQPDHKYKMNLYGLHGGQRQGPVSTVGITGSLPTEPPVAPRLGELAVAAVTSDTVSLSWTVAQGLFDSFLVQYKDVQGQPQAVPVGGHLHEITVSGLDPARKYKFLLFGLRDGKRHGPVSAEAKTISDMKSPRLGELTVTDVTPDSMTLSWTVPEGELDSFVIQYKDRDGQPRVVPVAADQREVTIPSLGPGRKYKFLLYGLAGRKRLGPISADGTTAPLEKERQRPPRLGELTVTDGTPDSLRLSWTVAQGTFDSFVVQYRDPAGQPQAVPAAKDQREVTIEGLEHGRKYKFLLYGLHGGQRLGPVSVLGVTAPEVDTPGPWHPATEAPEPPAGPQLQTLAVSDITPDSLRLSWSVAQGPFDSFVVQYQDTDGQPQALLVDGNQNKVQVLGLEPSTSYTFFLYGLHEGKRLGPVSTEGTTGPAPAGLTPGETGPRLSQLSVTDVTTSSLRLNWEAPSEAFDSFLLRFGVPSPSTLEPHPRPLQQRELTVPGSRRSAVLRDLRPGTLYSLTLYGLRGPHKADSIQGTARTLSPVLESPRDLQFSEIGETSAQVSWIPPASRVDSFKVSYQLADGGEPQSVQVDGRARTQKLKGLIPGSHYEVTVVSVRGFEESEPLTGFLTTVPDGPTQLRALNLTEGSALLHWKPPQTPVDKYKVRVTASGAPSLQGSAPGTAVEYPLSGLELHTNYTATVRGLRGPNLTAPASVTFNTGLEAPQDLEAKEVTPRTALLTWTEPQVLPTGYLLSFNTPGEQTQEILLPGGVTSHRLLGLFPSTPYSVWLRAMWGESLTPPVSTSFITGGLPIPFPRDCGEEMQNGASSSRPTTIFLNGNRERPLDVFCDMETDGGGWLVFQRRMDGQTDFWRDWEDYAHGFGNISGEFWLGNEALHSLTAAGDYSMRVDLRAGDEAVFAQYDSFRVDSATDYYRLHLDGYHGTAGDSMSYHSGSVFSARDRDPNNLLISCAVSYHGAWWYKNCHYANLNGLYGSTVDHQGVSWYYWKGFEFSVPFTEMKLRPRSYRPPAAQRG
ncbi:tenascin-X [Enhydra lutris kenyoni]|uniref:Tenascin-X n=1 Tax=Enhydra lutris kenyoni TaxID=391180 RepID=A0A2Y9JZ11_ENHLU|nr:tenascin-X [Enhydra lutris kenyoni]